MGFHTYDVERADALEDPSRFAHCSVEELWALVAPDEGDTVAEIGSGTGFFTDELAPAVGHLYAVDVQEEMHDIYREKGLPENVELVTAEAGDLPFEDGALDGAFSTFTFHEFAGDGALAELFRVLAPGARVGIIDWSNAGRGETGPPRDERFDATEAETMFAEAGFELLRAEERRETFALAARKPEN